MGFTDRLRNAWRVFKLSFSLLGKDKSLTIIPIIMVIINAVIIGLLIIWQDLWKGNIIFYLVIFFFMYFIDTFLSAVQTWMVYEVVQDKDTTIFSGFRRAMHNFSDILYYTFAVILILFTRSRLRKKGIPGKLASGILGIISGFSGRLVLPAMIITERHFGQAVLQLKYSLKAAPEVAAYEIGIGPLRLIAGFTGLLLSIILILIFGLFFGFVFAFVWFAILILIKIYVDKTYYTLVYLTLIEKKKIEGLKLN